MLASQPSGGEGAAGEERFRGLLAEAVDLPVFHARAILADADLSTPAGRDAGLNEVVPVLRGMGETITRQALVSEIADRLDTDPAMIGRRLGGAEPEPAQAPAAEGAPPRPPASRAKTVEERREEALLAMCIARPGPGAAYVERLGEAHLVGAGARVALPWLKQHLDAPLEGLPREDEPLFTEVSRLAMQAEREPAPEEAIELSWLIIERARIDREIVRLRREGDAEPTRSVELGRQRAKIADAIASRAGA
jgi:hypothetical protein